MTTTSSERRHLDTDQLLGTIPSGLFVVDLEMRIVSWNQAAEQITGFSAAEAVGRHCSFLQGIPCGERCGMFDPAVRKPLIGGLCTITGKDGRTVRIMKNIDFLRDGDGRVIGGIESFVDITRQHQLEADLRRQAGELERRVAERTRELDAFAHSISHDLRGLLAPVVTYMDFLQTRHRDTLDPHVLEILGEVERQAERAIMLLDDLLDLAQVGHIARTGEMADVAGLVAEVVRELSADGAADRPAVVVGDLPPIPLPDTLAYQVVANLVGNALSYAGRDGGPVEVGCREEPGRQVYFVRDHGPGVAPEERERIFEIFHRGSAARNTRGTGIGLAIVRKIARHCQGDAWAEETPGGGATFCLALPNARD